MQRRKPNGTFQIVVRKKGPLKRPAWWLTSAQDVGRTPTIEIGIISLLTDGFATAMPPTALVTETAGVKTPSARVRLENLSDVSAKVIGITHEVPNRHWKSHVISIYKVLHR